MYQKKKKRHIRLDRIVYAIVFITEMSLFIDIAVKWFTKKPIDGVDLLILPLWLLEYWMADNGKGWKRKKH